MITATNNRPLLARIGQAGIVALAAMVAVLAPSASRTASVESRLLAAGGERAMPIASAANFAATAIALRHWNKKEITVHVIASPNENKTAEQIASLVAQGLGLWNEKAGKTVHLSLTDAGHAVGRRGRPDRRAVRPGGFGDLPCRDQDQRAALLRAVGSGSRPRDGTCAWDSGSQPEQGRSDVRVCASSRRADGA
jgi:hypothetical protein